MKKQTKPVSLKRQLTSAVSMMLAAAVALGSSTYAWFVNRSRAEVKDVLFQASAGKNLEIAGAVAEEGNPYGITAGQQIPQDKAGLLTYYSSVTPEKLGKNSFTYPEYDPDAATPLYMTPVSIDGEDLKIDDTSIFYKNESWDAESNKGYNTYTKVNGNASKHYICAQMYFRSSENLDVYLNNDEWSPYQGTNDSTNGITVPFITQYMTSAIESDQNLKDMYKKQAADMATALRIAFVVDGEDGAADTVITACFDKNNHLTNAGYNTVQDGTLIDSDTPVKSIDDTAKTIKTYGTAVTNDLTAYTITGASTGAGVNVQTPSVDGKTELFSLKANTPKRVTVYIWLEGTDNDCVNEISSYIAGVYLPFVGAVDEGGTITTYGLEELIPEEENENNTVENEAAESAENTETETETVE